MRLELHDRGYPRISESRVMRLMRAEKLSAKVRKRKPRYGVEHGIVLAAPNRVSRAFRVGSSIASGRVTSRIYGPPADGCFSRWSWTWVLDA